MRMTPEFKVVKDIAPRSTGTLSAAENCTNAHHVRVWLQQIKTGGKAAKIVFRVSHHTASALFSSAVATAITGTAQSSAALSATRAIAFDIDMAGLGPWLIMKASCATASGNYGILIEKMRGPTLPMSTYNFTSTGAVGGSDRINYAPASP